MTDRPTKNSSPIPQYLFKEVTFLLSELEGLRGDQDDAAKSATKLLKDGGVCVLHDCESLSAVSSRYPELPLVRVKSVSIGSPRVFVRVGVLASALRKAERLLGQ